MALINARVSGVAPDRLEGLYRDRALDLWMPLHEEAGQETLEEVDRNCRNFWVVGRLRPHVSADQAQAAVGPSRGRSSELRVVPYTGMTPEMVGGLGRVVTLLGFAAGAVFFIACVNVACFLLGRTFARSHEVSLRVALGASRGQLAAGLLSDKVVVCVIGGALGTLLAIWTRM